MKLKFQFLSTTLATFQVFRSPVGECRVEHSYQQRVLCLRVYRRALGAVVVVPWGGRVPGPERWRHLPVPL